MKRYLVIDGTNLLFRCFWSAKKSLKEGQIPGRSAVYYFLSVLRSYNRQFGCDEIIVAWDDRDGDAVNERKLIDEEYKSTREYNADVFTHTDLLKRALRAFGVRQLHPKSREADDIMYWLCAYRYPNQCTLVTTDTDMYQLLLPHLNENVIYNPNKKVQITPVYLKMNYNVDDGRQYIIQKALCGDKSDNISGIRGLRWKSPNAKGQKLVSLMTENLDFEVLSQSGLLTPEEVKVFERNCSLMMLDLICDHKEEVAFYDAQLQDDVRPDKAALRKVVQELEFWTIFRDLDQWMWQFTNGTKKAKERFNSNICDLYRLPLD